jgi:LysM repeat protein
MPLSSVLKKAAKVAADTAKKGKTALKDAGKKLPAVKPKSKAQIKAGVLPKNPTSKQLVTDFKRSTQPNTLRNAALTAGGAGLVYKAGSSLGGGTPSKNMGQGSKPAPAGAWDTGKNGTGRTGAAKPTSSSSPTSGVSKSGGSYTAAKGDSLWSIAEKTVPKGKSVTSWWLAIKKMNTVNGKVRRLYTGTGVSLPRGARRS